MAAANRLTEGRRPPGVRMPALMRARISSISPSVRVFARFDTVTVWLP